MIGIVGFDSGHNILFKELLGGMERTAQLSRPQSFIFHMGLREEEEEEEEGQKK